MKSSLRYQEGHLYEHHGAWYVRYRRKVRHEDGSSTWKRTARRLGRSCDFTNSFDVGRNSCWLSIAIGSVPTQEPRSPRSSTEPSFLGPERSGAPAQATAIKPSGELIFAIESGTWDCQNF